MDLDILDILNVVIPIAVYVTIVAIILEIVIIYVRLATPPDYRRFLARDVYIVVFLIALTAGLFVWRDVERSQQPPHMTEIVAHTDKAGFYTLHFSAPCQCEGRFALETQDGTLSNQTLCEDRTYEVMHFVFDPPLPAGTVITQLAKSREARIFSEAGVEMQSYNPPNIIVGETSR